MKTVLLTGVLMSVGGTLQAAEGGWERHFAIPSVEELPLDAETLSETEAGGVKLTELYIAGAPFNGKPTRIYGWYSRPAAGGRHPAVLDLHGAGLQVLGPVVARFYASKGFCCLSIDWAGPENRKPPYSVTNSPGAMARVMPEGEREKYPPHGLKIFGVHQDGITNGVLFARRGVQFLRSRPEVDADGLCLSGASAGAHLALLVLGAEPTFRAATVKYGRGFVADLFFGGYFGTIMGVSREEQREWLAALDPKQGLRNYRTSVLVLSGTDDIFFWMPGVLATYRGIPSDKRLLMLPNDNHGQCGNCQLSLDYFRSVLGTAPAWPSVRTPTAQAEGGTTTLGVEVACPTKIAKVSFWVKRAPRGIFHWSGHELGNWTGRENLKANSPVPWIEAPASASGDGKWKAKIRSPGPGEQVMAYAMAEGANGFAASSDTVQSPEFPEWYGRAAYEPWEQERRAVDFKKAALSDPAKVAAVRAAGNLGGVLGCFEYEVWTPRSGWYELLVPNGQGVEYFVDDQYAFGTEGDKVGSFWLERGTPHTVKLRKLHWTAFPPVSGFSLRAVPPGEMGRQLRVTVADSRTILRKGESLNLMVESASPDAPANLAVVVTEAGKVVREERVSIPDWPGRLLTPLAVPCDREGSFSVSFAVNGKPVERRHLRPIALSVVDTTHPRATGGEIRKTLIGEVDCVATPPDFRCGDTRVARMPFGAYRESGDVGYGNHLNSTEPTWFAYRFEVPEKQKLYLIDVDYPDDALRTFVIAVREAAPDAYPTAGGVDSGGEFSLSHAMQTHTLMHWARSTDLRVLVIPAIDGRRAAAARIRVYRVDGDLPLPDAHDAGGRMFGNWYEEGSNFVAMYGAPDRSMAGMLVGADRWARTIRHIGGDTIWMSAVVYSFGLYPSAYNTEFNGPYTEDLVRAVLAKCEKYDMNFIAEFHPEARELGHAANADALKLHRSFSKGGGTQGNGPRFSALWPKNQEWYVGMVGEFVDRYRDSPALKGVCLRLMSWVNPGLNNLHSLHWGYGDYTISLFEKETGRTVPVDADDPKRFGKRYDWLMANAREEWIDWRCDKITELYRRIVDRVREARPDLTVYSNYFMSDVVADPREAGIDRVKLQSIPGVVLVGAIPYGRRECDRIKLQRMRDAMTDPKAVRGLAATDDRCSFLNGAAYFEAIEAVVPPEDLGFPVGTRRTWMSGVVNPAGRHSLERWAVELAETDSAFLSDGGNAYTVGQPVLRDFLREYRALPAAPFEPVAKGRDPVAIWERRDDGSTTRSRAGDADAATGTYVFYAVNRERYPVTVDVALQDAGRVELLATGEPVRLRDGVLSFDLEPYELRAFRAGPGARIVSVGEAVPESDLCNAEDMVFFLEGLAADARAGRLGIGLSPDQVELLGTRAAEARAELGKGHYWRVRTMMEHASLLEVYSRCRRRPPHLYEVGRPVAPAGAIRSGALLACLRKGRARLVRSEELDPSWVGETLLVSDDPVLEFEIEIPVDAMNGLEIGRVAGGACGDLELTVDGAPAGRLEGGGATPKGVLSSPNGLFRARHGKARLRVARVMGDTTALSFVAFLPVFTDLAADRWMAAGPFTVKGPDDADGLIREVIKAQRTDGWAAPERQRADLSAEYDFGGGAKAKWIAMTGSSDFVDFGASYDRYLGTICYAVTHIHSPSACRVRLKYGVDYWLRMWVNGELVEGVDEDVQNGAPSRGRFYKDVSLKAGWNEVLVKVASGSLGNGFWMAVSDPGDLRVEARPKQ